MENVLVRDECLAGKHVAAPLHVLQAICSYVRCSVGECNGVITDCASVLSMRVNTPGGMRTCHLSLSDSVDVRLPPVCMVLELSYVACNDESLSTCRAQAAPAAQPQPQATRQSWRTKHSKTHQ